MRMGRKATVLLLSGIVVGLTGLIALQPMAQQTGSAWRVGNMSLTSSARAWAFKSSNDAMFSSSSPLNATLFDSPIPGLCGDVAPSDGCDGVVDVKDTTLLLNYVGHPGEYSLCCDACGDVSPSTGCDGIIDVGDFILLLNYVAHPGEYHLCCEAAAEASGSQPHSGGPTIDRDNDTQ